MTPNPQHDSNPKVEPSIEELSEFLADPDGVEVVEAPQETDD